MTPKQLLFYSVYFSLWIQLITGMVQIHGILIEIDKGDFVLKEILILETIIQVECHQNISSTHLE